jgi:hypothetical protein
MLSNILAAIGGALTLNRDMFVQLRDDPPSTIAVLIVLVLAGVSLTIGQSVVLFANRVRPRWFLLALLGSAVAFIVRLFLWGLTIALICNYVLKVPAPPRLILVAVSVGQVPYLLGFLILLPYVGVLLRRLLDAYALVIVVAALAAMLEISLPRALAAAALGWALQALAAALLQRPLAGMPPWLWDATAPGRAAVRVDQLLGKLPEGGPDSATARESPR